MQRLKEKCLCAQCLTAGLRLALGPILFFTCDANRIMRNHVGRFSKVEPVATERQIQANRSNALKSTGPRSDQGKERSSGNALRHGLTAQRVVITGEDPEKFERLRRDLIEEFMPWGPSEELLVDQLAANIWRQLRVPVLEACLLEYIGQQHIAEEQNEDLLGIPDIADFGRLPRSAVHPAPPPQDPERLRIGRIVLEALSRGDLLGKLSNYEARLIKQFEKLMTELEKLRRSRPIPTPANDKT
jgi:hypothetical protein